MLGGFGPSQGIKDLECDLMDYCIEKKGTWWANHLKQKAMTKVSVIGQIIF